MPDVDLQKTEIAEVEQQHSEEAQEILGRVPSWIIRWGITMLFIIFAGIVVGCYFIKFPQIVTAPVIITTFNPPADLMARTTGRIESLFVSDGDSVTKGTDIALLYSTANYNDVKTLKDSLASILYDNFDALCDAGWIDQGYSLGEIQSFYLEFRRVYLDYKHYIESDNVGRKQGLIRAQIEKNREYYRKQLAQESNLKKDLEYERKNVERDSILYVKSVISGSDYDLSVRALLQKQSDLESFKASLTNTELNILQMEQQLIQLDIDKDNELASYDRQWSQVKQQLAAQIDQWLYIYVVTSPIDGKVTFIKYWSSNQSVQLDERIASVVPYEGMQVIGRIIVPTSGFGKVEVGQTVNIKLNGYPHMEFGMLKGRISSISDVPEEDGYVVEVELPEKLTTTYKRELNLIQEMDGTGDIITKDERLIMRFIQPIRALFDR